MRYPSYLLRIVFCALVPALLPLVGAEKLVLANSHATREYLQKRAADGKRQPQSYVFMAGRFLPGNTHDNSLQKTSFRTIAEQLATDLREQDFFPASALSSADLLLVVHWGVTAGRNRDSVALSSSMENLANINADTSLAQTELAEASARGDLEAAGRARDTLDALSNDTRSEYHNLAHVDTPSGENSAALLGLAADLVKEDGTLFDYERRKTLFEMTREECYFVIVMAYDAPTLVHSKKLKRVWTMRASMSSAGVNFHQALDRFSRIGGQYFGTKQDAVTFAYPRDRRRKERVDIGELIVIGAVDP